MFCGLRLAHNLTRLFACVCLDFSDAVVGPGKHVTFHGVYDQVPLLHLLRWVEHLLLAQEQSFTMEVLEQRFCVEQIAGAGREQHDPLKELDGFLDQCVIVQSFKVCDYSGCTLALLAVTAVIEYEYKAG